MLSQSQKGKCSCSVNYADLITLRVYIFRTNTISIQMTEIIYKPKSCAFHPKELIFNFCKNSDCLLPLCPTCIKIHSEEHRSQQTYGQFENMHKVVGDLNTFFQQTVKELSNSSLDIKDQQILRGREQQDLRKKIAEAKIKMITIVERFFTDFEKEVNKSIIAYNDSMKENYGHVEDHIVKLKKELQQKTITLVGEKVLKTVIGFHARQEEEKYNQELNSINSRIEYLDSQRVEVRCQPAAAQHVIDQLGNYIHLSFQNWQNEIKYVSEFVKTGFRSTGQGFART